MKTSKIYRICALIAHFFALLAVLGTTAMAIFLPERSDASVFGAIAFIIFGLVGASLHLCASDHEKEGR